MKKLIGTLVLMLFYACGIKCQSSTAVVYGYYEGKNNVVQLHNLMKEGDFILEDDVPTETLDAGKGFSLSTNLSQPTYFKMGRNILYLQPGDSVEVSINEAYPEKSLIRGKNANADLYLRSTTIPKGGSFLHSGESLKKTIAETLQYIDQAARDRRKILDNVDNISQDFRKIEEYRIIADKYNSIFYLYAYFPYKNKLSDSAKTTFYKEYKAATDSILFEISNELLNPALLDLPVFRGILYDLMNRNAAIKNNSDIAEYITASEFMYDISSLIKEKKLPFLIDSVANLKRSAYKPLLQRQLDYAHALRKGNAAPGFKMMDIYGKNIYLESLRGTITYIDIWATWCHPCLAEFPHFDTLRSKYKNRSDVRFISLSVDNNEKIWRAFLKKKAVKGEQLYTTRQSLEKYNVKTLPRALILDKNLNIVDIDAPMPSSGKLEGIIDKLLE